MKISKHLIIVLSILFKTMWNSMLSYTKYYNTKKNYPKIYSSQVVSENLTLYYGNKYDIKGNQEFNKTNIKIINLQSQ